ncbi:hypothetical protein JW826_03105, partial [Candidatus Woesearchaeota archaeon]|nr:hypothetical protein [Candidatus Woesearchaeota archaeon]
MDLSNKSLSLLLVAAIVISLAGTITTLNRINGGVTGLAAGNVTLTIGSTEACEVETNVSFG